MQAEAVAEKLMQQVESIDAGEGDEGC